LRVERVRVKAARQVRERQRRQVVLHEWDVRRQTRHALVHVVEGLQVGQLRHHEERLLELGVYELNRTELLKDVFIWAYERSAARYAAVQQSLGEPDPFRMRHRDALRAILGDVVRARMDRRAAAAHTAAWAGQNIAAEDRDAFRAMAEDELLAMHEGNIARYQIRPGEFAAWQEAWTGRGDINAHGLTGSVTYTAKLVDGALKGAGDVKLGGDAAGLAPGAPTPVTATKAK
jgi:hypothetical protein